MLIHPSFYWRQRKEIACLLPAVALFLQLLSAGQAGAGSIGAEFRVNSYIAGNQTGPAIAVSTDGRFVIVWRSALQDGGGDGVYAQRYDASGIPLGSEFRVNTYTTSDQQFPSVAMANDGRFVVAWESSGQDGNGFGVYAQRFSSVGERQGSEFRVNTYTSDDQRLPSVGIADDGRFVVAWISTGQDGSDEGVYAQCFDSTGTPLGLEFRVNTFTNGAQEDACAAMAADGHFVIAWESANQDGSSVGIYAQKYDMSGVPSGSEFRVNSRTYAGQSDPSVAMATDGRFVVAWVSFQQDHIADNGVYAQRYDAAGTPSGTEFRVNSCVVDNQEDPSVAMADNGRFMVVWQSWAQDGDTGGIYGQAYDALGAPEGPESRKNTYTADGQYDPGVAIVDDGRSVVTWDSNHQDGSGYGIYAQLYGVAVVSITCAQMSLSGGPQVTFRVTFNTEVTGVDITDFVLANTGAILGATITDVSGAGAEYIVTVDNIEGEGTLRLDLVDDDSIQDADGLPLGGPGLANANFTSGQAYQIAQDVPLVCWAQALAVLLAGMLAVRHTLTSS